MKTDVMSRVYALVASLALAVLATAGVAVSMTSTGEMQANDAAIRTVQAAKFPSSVVVADEIAVIEKTVVIGDRRTVSSWDAAAASPTPAMSQQQVL